MDRLRILRQAIASLEMVKVEFFDQPGALGMWEDDEKAIEHALAALRTYEPRERR